MDKLLISAHYHRTATVQTCRVPLFPPRQEVENYDPECDRDIERLLFAVHGNF